MLYIVKSIFLLKIRALTPSFLIHALQGGRYSYSRELFVDLRKLKMFCTHIQERMESKNHPTDFYEKHDCPSWVSQANTRQLLLSDLIPTTHFPAFQKALEKGPTSTSNDCKHTTDSLDTLFLNAAGLFPLALAEEPTPLVCLGRSRWEGSRENYK